MSNNTSLKRKITKSAEIKNSQFLIAKDYSNWKTLQPKQKLDSEQLEYFVNVIKNEFKKKSIVDNSFNRDKHELEVISFFEKKLASEINSSQLKSNQFKFYDLFCGAGGLSVGLEEAGLFPDLALDKDKSSLMTYHFNRPYLKDNQLINDDIKLVAKEFDFKKIPLVVGGPPCQGFSNANKQKKAGDDRNHLYKFYLKTVKMSCPDIFLLENVPGILDSINQIKKDFKTIKYTLYPYILNTKDFGFPQNRKRVFIVGINEKHSKIFDELILLFNKTIEKNKNAPVFTLWDAISDLPTLKAKTERNSTFLESKDWGYTFGKFTKHESKYSQIINNGRHLVSPILNHKSKFNNERDIKIYSLLQPGDKSDSDKIADINPYLSREDIFQDKFFKLFPNEPCKTITAHMYYDCHMYIHPKSSRGLTPREAARVQGFSDDYLFLGSPNEWYRQIGNAVSPLLGKILGIAINKMLYRIYEY